MIRFAAGCLDWMARRNSSSTRLPWAVGEGVERRTYPLNAYRLMMSKNENRLNFRKPHNTGFPWRSRTATNTPGTSLTAWNGRRKCRRPISCCQPRACCTTWAIFSGTTRRVPPFPRASRSTINAYNACVKRRWQWVTSGMTVRTSRATAWAV